MQSETLVEWFVEGHPIAQPRDTPSTILPSMDQLARAPRSPRPLWHWLREHTHATTRGVPEEHRIHAWKRSVLTEFRLLAREAELEKVEYPIEVDLVFVMPRPKSRTRNGKPNDRLPHDVKPDIDNLTKGVLDALNEFAWTDDKLITAGQLVAFVAGDGDRCGVAIRIRKASTDVKTWADHIIRESETTLF